MKGVVLAGGLGTRLDPLTLATNKHLLPVYDKPMIYYPLQTLSSGGITEVMVVTSGPHSGDFIQILKNGENFGFEQFLYGYQEKPNGGIADALSIAKNFVGNDDVAVILGDNTMDWDGFSNAVQSFQIKKEKIETRSLSSDFPLAQVFLKEVPDPDRFGVPTINDNVITQISEKPKNPACNYAVIGLYIYDTHVWNFIENCSPSHRGELEITDVNNEYIKAGELGYDIIDGFWRDAGTFDTLFEANRYWKEKHDKKG